MVAACDYSIKEDFPRAFENFDKALELARSANDTPSEGIASYWYGFGLSLNCEFEKVVNCLQRTLDIIAKINHLPRMSALRGLLGFLAYFYQGRIDRAYEATYEGLVMAERSGDTWSKALNYCCHGASCYGKGFLQEAIDNLTKSYALAEKIDQRYWKPGAQFLLGEIYFELDQYEKTKDHLRTAIQHLDQGG
jgi:tetratricopeptide (TPR) repeat protein